MTAKAKPRQPANRLNLPDGTGRAGEAAAQHILKSLRYTVLRANYRVREGEIDFVTELDGQTVFVEVKTRRSMTFGRPEESLTRTKADRLAAAAQSYLAEIDKLDADWRIDLLSIRMDRSGRVVGSSLIENAVTA